MRTLQSLTRRIEKLEQRRAAAAVPTWEQMAAARDRSGDWVLASLWAVVRREPKPSPYAGHEADVALIRAYDKAHGINVSGAREELQRRLKRLAERENEINEGSEPTC